jgi:hypothetical protein
MKTKNKIMMSGLMALVLGLGVTSNTFAYQNDYFNSRSDYVIDQPDFESMMTEVMNNVDYEGWKKLVSERVGDNKYINVINKENFPKFTKAWRLAKDGKIKEANTIRRELGLRIR